MQSFTILRLTQTRGSKTHTELPDFMNDQWRHCVPVTYYSLLVTNLNSRVPYVGTGGDSHTDSLGILHSQQVLVWSHLVAALGQNADLRR
jgi:hypothetical protein